MIDRRKNRANARVTIVCGVAGVILLSVWVYLYFPSSPKTARPTYFAYAPQETASLRFLTSSHRMTGRQLRRWEETAYTSVSQHKTGNSPAARFYATLFTAQRDAAFISWNSHGDFRGSLDPVSQRILCLFYPDGCLDEAGPMMTDPYSEALADIVFSKVKERMREDKANEREYPAKRGDNYWMARGIARGKSTGSWKPWLIVANDQFLLSPPPEPGSVREQEQIELVRAAYTELTEEQKRFIVHWAGGKGTKGGPGLWLTVATGQMAADRTPLADQLLIRSVLAMGLADAYIAANHYKYIYWAKRPFMVDDSLITYVPTPDHPSYPSSAAAIAGLSRVLFGHYFPAQNAYWDQVSAAAAQARVWSGIHFPVDVREGFKLGERIGAYIVENR